MMILFIDKPGAKYRGRLSEQTRELPVAPFYENPIELKGAGIFIERYENIGHGLSPYRMLAVYRGLRRSSELPRHFNPARLPI